MTQQDILKTLKILVIALALTLGVNAVFAAWAPAPASPPDNNVAAPLNVGSIPQGKPAGLNIGSTAGPDAGYTFQVTGGDSFFKGTLRANKITADKGIDVHTDSTDGTRDTTESIRAYGLPNTGYVAIGTGAGGGGIIKAPGKPLYLQLGGSNHTLLNVDSTGKVGIGTGVPRDNSKLDVKGEIDASGDICTDTGGRKCLSQAVITAPKISNASFKVRMYFSSETGAYIGDHLFCALTKVTFPGEYQNTAFLFYLAVPSGGDEKGWYLKASSYKTNYQPDAQAWCLDVI